MDNSFDPREEIPPNDEPPAWFTDYHPSSAPNLPDPISLLWFKQIRPCLDVNDFVQGLLIEGSAAVVYGESNAGKTFWTTDLALHVAAGFKWNGRRVEQGGVIYCSLEGSTAFLNRVAAWRDAHRLPLDADIPFAAVRSSLNLLDPKADTPRLIEAIQAAARTIDGPVKMIVIDTLSRALAGGNENAPDDMGALVSNMDLIRTVTGACVLFVHHCGKDQARGARGHSLLHGAIDTEIEVTATPEGKDRSATVVKQRDLPKGGVFGFQLESVEMGRNRYDEAVTTLIVKPAEPGQGGKAKSGKNGLSDSQKNGLRALDNAIGQTGALLPATAEYPPNTLAVSQNDWRDEFYQLNGGEADANRQAFNRSKKALLADQLITQRNGLVWKVHP
jgi:AAA domain